METYGVNMDGFEPWCGRELYDDVVKDRIPGYEESIVGVTKEFEGVKRTLRSVEELRKPMLGMKGLAEKAAAIVGESVVAKDCRMNELLRKGSEEFQKLLTAFEAYHKWLKEDCLSMCACCEEMYAELEEGLQSDFRLYEGLIEETKVKRDFWRLMADTAKVEYLFENADKKYKAKVCRDAVRDLSALQEKGRAYLKWLENSHVNFSEEQLARQVKNVKEIMDEMRPVLSFYKKLKACIAERGIDGALVRYEKFKRDQKAKEADAGPATGKDE